MDPAPPAPPHRGLFLDRDGVLNARVFPFVRRPADFRWTAGTLEALARAKRAGWKLVVVTNQWPVGSGLVRRADLDAIHARMRAEAAAAGAAFDAVEACVHGALERCDDAKPAPTMILRAARALDVDPRASWMLGDQRKDVLAGRAAGCRTALVDPARRRGVAAARKLADVVAPDVATVVERLLASDERLLPGTSR